MTRTEEIAREASGADPFEDLFSRSASMGAAVYKLREAASSDAPLLIGGSRGTGKKFAAGIVHRASRRGGGPFTVVHCSSLPGSSLALELFGVEGDRGDSGKRGVLETGDRGTVVLDEIATLDANLQQRLARLLREGTLIRIGGQRPRRVDVRIVATTCCDLGKLAERGAFDSELVELLCGHVVQLPRLRDRVEDIPLLVRRFVDQAQQASPEVGRAALPEDVVLRLQARGWPDNVRELKEIVLRFVSEGDRALRDVEAAAAPPPYRKARARALEDFEKGYLQLLLDYTDGNVAAASRAAGVNRSYLFRLLRRYDIERK